MSDDEDEDVLNQTADPAELDMLEKSHEPPPQTVDDAEERLNALLAKSEQLTQFVQTEEKKDAQSGDKKRGRKTEAEEDEEMTKQGEGKMVRLSEQPSSIQGKMRYYQLEALNWMINLHNQKINGILADEMGLGKTLETISLLAYLKEVLEVNGPFLVIVPKSTMNNWLRECKRWCPSLDAKVFHGSKEERVAQKEFVGKTDVLITTYEMALLEKSTLLKVQWYYLIIDEAHRIKNDQSSLALVVRALKSRHRLLITGTPLQNNLHELWALLNFLLPAVFNSAVDFQSWFDVTKDEGRSTIAARLHKILKPFLLRRLKVDVEKDLPAKVETKLYVGLSAMQRQWYTTLLSRDMEVLNGQGKQSKMRLLNIVMQLRKVCNHPYLFTGAEPGPPYMEGEHLVQNAGKMVLLDKLLTKLKAQGSRVLIFSQMTRLLDILEDYSRYRGFNYCRIDGSTKQEDRDQGMDLFNAPKSPKFLFLLSTRAGGLGINLQTADTVILYDSDWNPQMDLQAQDRAHRIGQTKVVHVYRFVTEATVEEKIIERAMRKLYLDAVVIKQGRLADKDAMNAQELQAAIRFGASRIFQSKEGTITEEDIDAIISRGTTKTAEDTAKLKEIGTNNLLNFSISGADSSSVYDFEGKSFDSKKPFDPALFFIEPPKRERKQNYDINQYYREAMQLSDTSKKTKTFRPTPRMDFQFFDGNRLDELEKKEWESKINLKFVKEQARAAEKEFKKRQLEEEREKKRVERAQKLKEAEEQGVEPKKEEGDTPAEEKEEEEKPEKEEDEKPEKEEEKEEDEDSEEEEESKKEEDKKEQENKKGEGEEEGVKKEPTKSPQKNTRKTRKSVATLKKEEEEDEDDDKRGEMEAAAGCLTEAEKAEKAKLDKAGFGDWNRKHFQSFLKACETYGRKQMNLVCTAVEDKSPAEVKRYWEVFWKRYKELKEHDKYIKQIERGEARLQRCQEINDLIKDRMARCSKPFTSLKIPYPAPQKTFSEEEDRWMICTLKELGWGQWVELKREVRNAWQFRFDWFLKSRTWQELSRRCDYLIKLLEKEQEQEAEKAKAKAKSKRKASEKKPKSTKKSKRD